MSSSNNRNSSLSPLEDTITIPWGCGNSKVGTPCDLHYYQSNPPIPCPDCNYNKCEYYYYCDKHKHTICESCVAISLENKSQSGKHDEEYEPNYSDLSGTISNENTNNTQPQPTRRSSSSGAAMHNKKRRKSDSLNSDLSNTSNSKSHVNRRRRQRSNDSMDNEPHNKRRKSDDFFRELRKDIEGIERKYKEKLNQYENKYAQTIGRERKRNEDLVETLHRKDYQIRQMNNEIYNLKDTINCEKRKCEQMQMNNKNELDELNVELDYEIQEKEHWQGEYKLYKEQKENELNEFNQRLEDVTMGYKINMKQKEEELNALEKEYKIQMEEKDKELDKLREENVCLKQQNKDYKNKADERQRKFDDLATAFE